MAKTKTVVLSEPIEGHDDARFSRLVFREPTYRELMALGEPTARAYDVGHGMAYSADKDEVIRQYAEKLLVEPADALLLNQLGLADALRVKEAVLDFFSEARATIMKLGPSSSSATQESSTPSASARSH